MKWINLCRTEQITIPALLISPLYALLLILADLSSCQPHLNVLPQAPFKSLRSSSPHPTDLVLRSPLSTSSSLALPFISSHPANLIAMLCQMSQRIVPPVKSWWGVCPIQPSNSLGLGSSIKKRGVNEAHCRMQMPPLLCWQPLAATGSIQSYSSIPWESSLQFQTSRQCHFHGSTDVNIGLLIPRGNRNSFYACLVKYLQ